MSKRITTRTIVPVAVIMAAFITVCFILLYTYIQVLMQEASAKPVACMAKTVARSMSYDMLNDNHAALEYAISNVGMNPGVVHLRIFDKKGVIRFSKDPKEIGQLVDHKAESCNICHSNEGTISGGSDIERLRYFEDKDRQRILGLSYPIPRQEGCSTDQCHVGEQHQPLLGIVDIGMSQRSLEANMLSIAKVLVGFWFMVVLLSVGLVAAILKKSVLIPIDKLYRYVKQLRRGIYVEPALEDTYELEYIAESVKELADKVKKQELG